MEARTVVDPRAYVLPESCVRHDVLVGSAKHVGSACLRIRFHVVTPRVRSEAQRPQHQASHVDKPPQRSPRTLETANAQPPRHIVRRPCPWPAELLTTKVSVSIGVS